MLVKVIEYLNEAKKILGASKLLENSHYDKAYNKLVKAHGLVRFTHGRTNQILKAFFNLVKAINNVDASEMPVKFRQIQDNIDKVIQECERIKANPPPLPKFEATSPLMAPRDEEISDDDMPQESPDETSNKTLDTSSSTGDDDDIAPMIPIVASPADPQIHSAPTFATRFSPINIYDDNFKPGSGSEHYREKYAEKPQPNNSVSFKPLTFGFG